MEDTSDTRHNCSGRDRAKSNRKTNKRRKTKDKGGRVIEFHTPGWEKGSELKGSYKVWLTQVNTFKRSRLYN